MSTLIDKMKSKKKSAKVSFFEKKDEIDQAVKDGWSAKAVWEVLKEEGAFDYSYSIFNRYWNKFCLEVEPKPTKSNATEGHNAQRPTETSNTTKGVKKPKIGGLSNKEAFGYTGAPKSDSELF